MPAIIFNSNFYNKPFSDELEKLITAGDSTRQVLRYLKFWVEDVLICRIEENLLTAYWEKGRKSVVSNKVVNARFYKDEATKNGVTVLKLQGKYAKNNQVELNYRGPNATDTSIDFLFRPVDSESDNAIDFFNLPVEYCDLV